MLNLGCPSLHLAAVWNRPVEVSYALKALGAAGCTEADAPSYFPLERPTEGPCVVPSVEAHAETAQAAEASSAASTTTGWPAASCGAAGCCRGCGCGSGSGLACQKHW